MARFYRLICLFALLFGGAMALHAQDLRTREDDGGRPEEDNISGYHHNASDLVIYHTVQSGETTGGNEADESSEGTEPQRIQPGSFDLDAALSVYPNPVSSVLFIELTDELEVVISLHSLIGNEVYRFEGQANTHRIEVNDFQPGIYFVRMAYGDKQVVRKIKITH